MVQKRCWGCEWGSREQKPAWGRQLAGIAGLLPPWGFREGPCTAGRQQHGQDRATEQTLRGETGLGGGTECSRSPAGPCPAVLSLVSKAEERGLKERHLPVPIPHFLSLPLLSKAEAFLLAISTGESTFIDLQISEMIPAFLLKFSVLTYASIRFWVSKKNKWTTMLLVFVK